MKAWGPKQPDAFLVSEFGELECFAPVPRSEAAPTFRALSPRLCTWAVLATTPTTNQRAHETLGRRLLRFRGPRGL